MITFEWLPLSHFALETDKGFEHVLDLARVFEYPITRVECIT